MKVVIVTFIVGFTVFALGYYIGYNEPHPQIGTGVSTNTVQWMGTTTEVLHWGYTCTEYADGAETCVRNGTESPVYLVRKAATTTTELRDVNGKYCQVLHFTADGSGYCLNP